MLELDDPRSVGREAPVKFLLQASDKESCSGVALELDEGFGVVGFPRSALGEVVVELWDASTQNPVDFLYSLILQKSLSNLLGGLAGRFCGARVGQFQSHANLGPVGGREELLL